MNAIKAEPSIIIMGIDPGSRITGYGLIKVTGSQHEHIASGCIRLKAPTSSGRLQQIFADLKAIISQYQPQEIAVERIFFHHNPAGALQLGQARGTALVAVQEALAGLGQEDLERQQVVAEYSARQIKQAVVGHGAAKKDQVQFMVRALLNLTELPPPDAADALAAALCHSHVRRLGGLTILPRRRRSRRRGWR